MDPVEVLDVLLYTAEGEEFRVQPLHAPSCTKQKNKVVSAFTCEGCRFDVAANELLALCRVELPIQLPGEEAANYENN